MDQRRLYEVGAAGGAWTVREDPAAKARRLARLRWLFALGVGANAATWSLAGIAFVVGGPRWGATFGILALATAPLVLLPGFAEAAARRRARRRHARRPPDFPTD